MKAKQLADKTRLQEIYDLRVTAYANSPYATYINRNIYPNGYYDYLDSLDSTKHWIVEDSQKIIGSVRAAIVKNISDLKEDLTQLGLPNNETFAYCGRTAVHPKFRNGQVILQLDQLVINFIKEDKEIKFALCYVIPERVNAVKKLGFHFIGSIQYDWGNGFKSLLDAYMLTK